MQRVAEYRLAVDGKASKAKTFEAGGITPAQNKKQSLIARLHERLPDNDFKNPVTARAHKKLSKELVEQFKVLPVKVEIYECEGQPYENSSAMRADILDNNHPYIFGTNPDTFGPKGVSFRGHPLLKDSGVTDASKSEVDDKGNAVGRPMLRNDPLRAVLAYYAHAMKSAEFVPKGEEAAWKNHMAMTKSQWARWALTSETWSQNSWVNFRPGAKGVAARDRAYARQKAAPAPIEYAMTGRLHISVCVRGVRIHRRFPPGATAGDAKRVESE